MESNFLAQKLLSIITKQKKNSLTLCRKADWRNWECWIYQCEVPRSVLRLEKVISMYHLLGINFCQEFWSMNWLLITWMSVFNWFWMGVLVDKFSIHLFFLLMIRLSLAIVKISCITSAFYAWLGYTGFYN